MRSCTDDHIETTVDIEAHRAPSDLDDLVLDDDQVDAA